MIASLTGLIQAISLKTIVIDVNGVGYKVHLSNSDLSRLKLKEKITCFVHTNVKDDAIDLFGFLKESSMNLFEHLISVSGVGPKLALTILSGMPVEDFKNCVATQDSKRLTQIPGIGKKGAERIVLELKDRLKKETSPLFGFKENKASSLLEDVRSAILNLGYKDSQVDSALTNVKELALRGANLQDVLKEALKHMSA